MRICLQQPIYSSHMGGTFERQIRTVRSILNNILHTNYGYRTDTPSLMTFLYEVMSLVNSRPLSGTFIQDKKLEPLTPNHLIMMKSTIITPPPGNFDATDLYASKRWRQVQQLTNMFWEIWERVLIKSTASSKVDKDKQKHYSRGYYLGKGRRCVSRKLENEQSYQDYWEH